MLFGCESPDTASGQLRSTAGCAQAQTYVMADNRFRLNAAFRPDGTQIVSSANDIITIWDASPLRVDFETWIADNRYVPDFTCDQRELYRIEPLCEPEQ